MLAPRAGTRLVVDRVTARTDLGERPMHRRDRRGSEPVTSETGVKVERRKNRRRERKRRFQFPGFESRHETGIRQNGIVVLREK